MAKNSHLKISLKRAAVREARAFTRWQRLEGSAACRTISTATITLFDNCLRDLIGQHLAIVRVARLPAIAPIAQETAFDEHGRLIRLAQNAKVGHVHTAIGRARNRDQLRLDSVGQLGRLGRMIVRLEPLDSRATRVIEMNADENRIVLSIFDLDAVIEWDENVAPCAS